MPDEKISPDDIPTHGAPDYLRNHTDPTGTPRPDLWRQGIGDFGQLEVAAEGAWEQIGPAPLSINGAIRYQGSGVVSGEVTDIAIDPSGTTDDNLYLATNDGGIWKITQGGILKSPATDSMSSLSMGAVALDPGNPQIVYAGTGNLFDGGNVFTKGVGLYKSTDAGGSWSIVDGGPYATVFTDLGIIRIVIPAPDVLLVATNKGLYRSINGGGNFGANAPDFNDGKPIFVGGGIDKRISGLTLDPLQPSTVYACVSGVGVFVSIDAGASFSADNVFDKRHVFDAANSQFDPTPFSDLILAQSTRRNGVADNGTMYLSVQYSPGLSFWGSYQKPVYIGLFKSTDAGLTWHLKPEGQSRANQDGARQTNYDLTLGVDPQDPERVYLGFQQLWCSTDGGNTFSDATLIQNNPDGSTTRIPLACTDNQVHWDHHAVVFSPSTHWASAPSQPTPRTTVYVGTDGGVAHSTNGGNSWDQGLNQDIATNLFVGIDIGRGAGNGYTYGGCQDTGTSEHAAGDSELQWHAGINGDGGLIAVDPTQPLNAYGSDDGSLIVSHDGGQTWTITSGNPPPVGIGLPNPDPYDRATWLRCIAIDPNHPNVIYATVASALYKSSDSGVHFAKLKSFSASITVVTLTRRDSQRLWIGLADGTVHMSSDGGNSWDPGSFTTEPGGPGAIGAIAIDSAAAATIGRVAVGYKGFSKTNPTYRAQRVYLTSDNGNSWQDISGTDGSGPVGNVPNLAINAAVFDPSSHTNTAPSTLIIACDSGVIRSKDDGASWQILGAGLPTVECTSLALDDSVSPALLRVGTYGRSVFELRRLPGPRLVVVANLGFGPVVNGQSTTIDFQVFNAGSADLHIASVDHSGNAAFSLASAPAFPVIVAAGAKSSFTVQFQPTAAGMQSAMFSIVSDDAAHSPLSLSASGNGVASGSLPRIAVYKRTLGFGSVSKGNGRSLTLRVANTGGSDLEIHSFTRTSGSSEFTLDPAPALPATLHPRDELDFTVHYTPSSWGDSEATFEISSNDPRLDAATHNGNQIVTMFGTPVGFVNPWLVVGLVVLGVAVAALGVYGAIKLVEALEHH